MTTPAPPRNDVVAVGTLSFNSDTFLIGATHASDPFYYTLAYDTVNNQYVYLYGGIGSLLSGQDLTAAGYEIHYFKVQQNNLAPSPASNFFFNFIPFLDAAGTTPKNPGSMMVPSVDTNNVLTLRLGNPDLTTFTGIRIDSPDPIYLPSVGNLVVGYHYNFYTESNGKVLAATIPVFLQQGFLDSTQNYGLMPYGVGLAAGSSSSPYQAVMLPVNWFVSNQGVCQDTISPTPDAGSLVYHFCDRYRFVSGPAQAGFYQNYCLDIDTQRGNTQQTDCLGSGGFMYYYPDGSTNSDTLTPGPTLWQTCGQAWSDNSIFTDMANRTITGITNSYGSCISLSNTAFSACTFDTTGQPTCTPVGKNFDPCTVSQQNFCKTQCPVCTQGDCAAGQGCPANCTGCDTTCTDSPTGEDIPWWVWLLLIILAIVLVVLVLAFGHRKTDERKTKTYTDYDHPEDVSPPNNKKNTSQ